MIITGTISNTCSLFIEGMSVVGYNVLQSYMDLFDIIKRLVNNTRYSNLYRINTVISCDSSINMGNSDYKVNSYNRKGLKKKK